MHHTCAIDYGMTVMWSCLAGMIGLLVGCKVTEWQNRKPPS